MEMIERAEGLREICMLSYFLNGGEIREKPDGGQKCGQVTNMTHGNDVKGEENLMSQCDMLRHALTKNFFVFFWILFCETQRF
jgi:hypothetical protein